MHVCVPYARQHSSVMFYCLLETTAGRNPPLWREEKLFHCRKTVFERCFSRLYCTLCISLFKNSLSSAEIAALMGWVVCPDQSVIFHHTGWGLLWLTRLSPGFPNHQLCATAAFLFL